MFNIINRNILFSQLKLKIRDQILFQNILKMFKTNVINPFNIFENKLYFSQDNILSPILFNIYFHTLDCFIEKYIIKRYKKNLKIIKLLSYSKHSLFLNIKKKNLKKKKSILYRYQRKKNYITDLNNIKNSYICVKYIRHTNNIILGIIGPKFLAEKILKNVTFFLKSNLQLNINKKKPKLLNSYSNKIPFLNMLFYNTVNKKDSFYKYKNNNIENKSQKRLRIINRINILKYKQTKILKKKCLTFLRNTYTIYQKSSVNIKKDFFSLIKNSLIFKDLSLKKTNQFIYRDFLKDIQQIIQEKKNSKVINYLELRKQQNKDIFKKFKINSNMMNKLTKKNIIYKIIFILKNQYNVPAYFKK